jgi:hypothetical protein
VDAQAKSLTLKSPDSLSLDSHRCCCSFASHRDGCRWLPASGCGVKGSGHRGCC